MSQNLGCAEILLIMLTKATKAYAQGIKQDQNLSHQVEQGKPQPLRTVQFEAKQRWEEVCEKFTALDTLRPGEAPPMRLTIKELISTYQEYPSIVEKLSVVQERLKYLPIKRYL